MPDAMHGYRRCRLRGIVHAAQPRPGRKDRYERKRALAKMEAGWPTSSASRHIPDASDFA
ncbi:MAG: hypothetical protein QOF74_4406 [Caballeronia mineralivorans]|jgi:hypothetical protein|nr:hypothetical protein [Caballeronia mineralivorans]